MNEEKETVRKILHDHYARNARRAAAVIRGTEKARIRATTAARARWNKKEIPDDTERDDHRESDRHIQPSECEAIAREEPVEIRADDVGNGLDTRCAEDLDETRKRIIDDLFFGEKQ